MPCPGGRTVLRRSYGPHREFCWQENVVSLRARVPRGDKWERTGEETWEGARERSLSPSLSALLSVRVAFPLLLPPLLPSLFALLSVSVSVAPSVCFSLPLWWYLRVGAREVASRDVVARVRASTRPREKKRGSVARGEAIRSAQDRLNSPPALHTAFSPALLCHHPPPPFLNRLPPPPITPGTRTPTPPCRPLLPADVYLALATRPSRFSATNPFGPLVEFRCFRLFFKRHSSYSIPFLKPSSLLVAPRPNSSSRGEGFTTLMRVWFVVTRLTSNRLLSIDFGSSILRIALQAFEISLRLLFSLHRNRRCLLISIQSSLGHRSTVVACVEIKLRNLIRVYSILLGSPMNHRVRFKDTY